MPLAKKCDSFCFFFRNMEEKTMVGFACFFGYFFVKKYNTFFFVSESFLPRVANQVGRKRKKVTSKKDTYCMLSL